jgi:hypothetical protein
MIEAEEVENRRVQVIHMNTIDDRPITSLIGFKAQETFPKSI